MPETAALAAVDRLNADSAQEARQYFRNTSEEVEAEKSRQRRVLYEDVEDLINVGFLAHMVQVGPMSVSLRSLSPSDTFLLQHRVGMTPHDRLWKTWSVAASIWMVDGVSLLEDPHAVPKVFKLIRRFPTPVIDILFSTLMGLFNRTTQALARTEAYCYEQYSRTNWRMEGRQAPKGLRAGRIGMNHVQRMWVAFNASEDDREQVRQRWAQAKLVASATAPKGIRKLNAADERLRTQEESRRRLVIEKMVNTVLFGEEPVEEQAWQVVTQAGVLDVPAVKVARTPEELDEQFRAWVAGEKDWHDMVVDRYKERIRERFQNEKVVRQRALDEVVGPGVTGGVKGGSVVGYTLEQLEDLRAEFSVKEPQGRRRVFDNHTPSVIYEKWVREEASPGRLHADAAGVYEAPLDQSEEPTLQEKLKGRQPQFSTEPIGRPSDEGGS